MPGPVTGNEARSLAPLDYGSPPKSRINCAFYIRAFVSPPNRSERRKEKRKRKKEKERKKKRNKKKSIKEEREKRKGKKGRKIKKKRRGEELVD